jgi:hypothetical protein
MEKASCTSMVMKLRLTRPELGTRKKFTEFKWCSILKIESKKGIISRG